LGLGCKCGYDCAERELVCFAAEEIAALEREEYNELKIHLEANDWPRERAMPRDADHINIMGPSVGYWLEAAPLRQTRNAVGRLAVDATISSHNSAHRFN
jgi:hypothetical protein